GGPGAAGRRHGARSLPAGPVQRRERDVARDRRHPPRRTDPRLPDVQAGVLPAHRQLPGRRRPAAARRKLTGPAQLGGRGPGRHRARAPRGGRSVTGAGPIGAVTLVGGGPGDVDLLTIAGRRALAEADVVVTDRLGPTGVLAELAEEVEVIQVGKEPGRHPVPQQEIITILVDQARRGRRVVRLKGGDPFLFGRGGEEVLACREAGVPVTVLPGVSSALAAPALAGIPATHRGVAGAVHVTTGHAGLDPAA